MPKKMRNPATLTEAEQQERRRTAKEYVESLTNPPVDPEAKADEAGEGEQ